MLLLLKHYLLERRWKGSGNDGVLQGNEHFKQLQQQVSSAVKQGVKRLCSKINSLQQQMGSTEESQQIQKQADLLTANIYRSNCMSFLGCTCKSCQEQDSKAIRLVLLTPSLPSLPLSLFFSVVCLKHRKTRCVDMCITFDILTCQLIARSSHSKAGTLLIAANSVFCTKVTQL